MKKKALSLLICTALVLTMTPVIAWADSEGIVSEEAVSAGIIEDVSKTNLPGEPILAYVPLDNRPVNVDRVVYEAESAGFKVMMPDRDLYTTRLDGQPVNSNGTQFGDSQKLLDWISEMDKETDYFVISLDQLLSGGLVNSRSITKSNYDKEYKIIDAIVELSKSNHVYIIDTVARLSTCTVEYQGATLETYNYLRQYNLVPRKVLNDNVLTINRIVTSYTRDNEYKQIPVDKNYSKEIKNALKTRERKLNLIDYILTKDTSGRMKYFIGIDDSSSAVTIQTNEINYIRNKMDSRGLIYSGTDELGMMAVLGLMIDYYGYNVNAAVAYFGDTESSSAGSIYDLETVKKNVEEHIKSIGVQLTGKKDADIEIVVLSAPAQAILSTKYISKMIDYINDNISKGVPTIVINSAPGAYSGNLEYRMIRECEMSMLLSYSSWNTVGNSIGLALCNGISRYLYLHSRDNSTDTADIAFLKGLTFSYQKDISYIRGGGKTLFNDYLAGKGWSASNFYQDDEQVKMVNVELENIFKTAEYNVTVNDIIDNLTGCRYFKGLGGECGIIGKIRLSNYSAPFFRTFEIRFDIDVDLSDITINGFKDNMMINMPYVPAEGQHTYAFTLYYLDESGKVQKVPSTYDETSGSVIFSTDKMSRFFTSALNIEKEKANSLFSDVPVSAWYFNDVIFVYEKGLMRGVTGSTFEPAMPMSRAMLAYTIYNMAGAPEPQGEEELPPDVGNRWYQLAAQWSMENGIIMGYANGNLGPDDPVTREQLAAILWRYANYVGEDVSKGSLRGVYSFPDVFNVSQDLRDQMDWACSIGLIKGKSGLLMPKDSVTRAEVAAVLKRFMEE